MVRNFKSELLEAAARLSDEALLRHHRDPVRGGGWRARRRPNPPTPTHHQPPAHTLVRAVTLHTGFGSSLLHLAALLTITGLVASTMVSGGRAAAAQPRTRVTLISDSVAGAIALDTGATAALSQGIDLFLEPGQARILGGEYPRGAIVPPSAVDLIGRLGHNLGPVVVVSVGCNDLSSDYATHMEDALAAMRAAAVRRVLWVTLHVSPNHTSYAAINDAIWLAASQHPEITVVDWNTYSATHAEWFQQDDVHLAGDGPRALARLIHAALVAHMR